jgi:hypothetical protein
VCAIQPQDSGNRVLYAGCPHKKPSKVRIRGQFICRELL